MVWEKWKEDNATQTREMHRSNTEYLMKFRMNEIFDKLHRLDVDLHVMSKRITELERRIDAVEEKFGGMNS